uniref:Uncharacterized protein n=1 Tax=Arundo donax TaxID=35708 RepID=A0A0A9FVZ9_ARUDO
MELLPPSLPPSWNGGMERSGESTTDCE